MAFSAFRACNGKQTRYFGQRLAAPHFPSFRSSPERHAKDNNGAEAPHSPWLQPISRRPLRWDPEAPHVTPEAELRLSALHGGKGLCSAPRSRARAHPARRPAPSAPHRLTAHARPRKEKRAEPAAAPGAPRHLPRIEDVSVHPIRPTTSNGSAHTKAPPARCTSSKHQHSHC